MWARHWRIHLLQDSRGFISQPKELFSPLLMTRLLEWQDKARDCSLEDWGEASAVSSYLPPSSLHQSPDSSDSIIAISRVSPRDCKGISELPQIQLILPYKISFSKGSSEIPLISLLWSVKFLITQHCREPGAERTNLWCLIGQWSLPGGGMRPK